MNSGDCIFCGIASGRIPCTKVFENEHVLAFLDIRPAAEGHTLVISRKHSERIDQTDPADLARIAQVLPKLTAALTKTLQCDGYNVLCNNGKAAGQAVGHVHFHIIPRRTGDKVLREWAAIELSQEKASQIAQNIQKNMQ